MRRTAIVALSVLALGCHFGPRADDLAVAREPRGARTRIAARTGITIDGELLAVLDTGLVVLWSRQVGYMPYVQTLTLSAQTISLSIAKGRLPSPGDREHLRLMSRFPQGLTPDLEARLLAAHHQRAIVVLAQ
ncbi:MAG TPA: hypothetical protein VJO52_06020 [Gemmatimonadaceae bacterium]|nr:hypothetical protein [Gemmatimonadaceae bacterium]